ncbi:hypothetical protein CDL12_15461 [Handroanthus impetiginosus]|uniref:MBD domain-containing protein n=1 Tax=Handroanthus impetiginosus TaxID=429701 RepID=A0A2G9H327_9LAMI|nr:hypothetical protein CDL12_15461 [Handroanthus impetiginosus]
MSNSNYSLWICYSIILNGLKFNSKVEVHRYLKNADKDMKLKEINKSVAIALIYDIDHVSGRHFRSTQEVLHYLETKDTRKVDSQGDRSKFASRLLYIEGQKLIGKKADKMFNGDERQSETEDGSVNWDLRDKQRKENENGRHGEGLRQNKRLADGKLKKNVILDQSLRLQSEGAAVKSSNMLRDQCFERKETKNSLAEDRQQEILARHNKRKKLYSKWMRADPLLELKTRQQAREAEVNATANLGNSDEPNENLTICRTKKKKKKKEKTNDNKEKEPANLPLENLCSVEENEDGIVDLKENVKQEKHPESSLNGLLMDPCIEFAIETFTGATPIKYVNKVEESSPNQTICSSSALPSGYIWANPCFEFAVKMLTSETQMENALYFEISFQQPQFIRSYNKALCTHQGGVRDQSLPQALNGGSQNFIHQP